MMSPIRFRRVFSVAVAALFLFRLGDGDINADRAKCADTLGGVITCLPFVSDQAKSPTKDCCSGFETVLRDSPQCICLLIKDRNDPSLGLQIDVARATSLPQICKIHTNRTVGDCPAILNLPPNSPDALVFQQFGNVTGAQAPSQAPPPVTAGTVTLTPPTNGTGKSKGETASFWAMIFSCIVASRVLRQTTSFWN